MLLILQLLIMELIIISLKIALDMVRKSGITRVSSIGNSQAQELIDSLFACSEPNRTPAGNPVMAIITMEELANKL